MYNKFTIALLMSLPLTINAQTTNNIKQVGQLNIYGNGKTVIGQIIIESSKTRIYFAGSQQTIDSAGIYTTKYYFAPMERLSSFAIDIKMKFNHPLVTSGIGGFDVMPNGAGTLQGTSGMSDDKTAISAQYQVTSSGYGSFISVKSKEPLYASIYGVDGQLK